MTNICISGAAASSSVEHKFNLLNQNIVFGDRVATQIAELAYLSVAETKQKLFKLQAIWQRTSQGDRQLLFIPFLNNLVIPGLISALEVPKWVEEICDSLESNSQSDALEHFIRGLYLAYKMELPAWAVRVLLDAHEVGADNSDAARAMDIANNRFVLKQLASLSYLDSLSGTDLKLAIQFEALSRLSGGELIFLQDVVSCH